MLLLLMLVFIGLSAALAWYLIAHDRGAKEPVGALWMAAGLGVAGAILAGFLESHYLNPDNLLPGMPLGTILATALAVGAIEELCKFVPLAILIYKQRFFNEYTDGVIYFALAGLGFGLPENILYTLQFGEQAGLVRLFLTPLFHAAATGLVGYYLIKYKLTRKPFALIILPLAFVIALHGAYDFGLSSGVTTYTIGALLVTLGLSIALFLLYLRATEHDEDRGLSAVGHNNFCRSCGRPNPHSYLYCTNCGKLT